MSFLATECVKVPSEKTVNVSTAVGTSFAVMVWTLEENEPLFHSGLTPSQLLALWSLCQPSFYVSNFSIGRHLRELFTLMEDPFCAMHRYIFLSHTMT